MPSLPWLKAKAHKEGFCTSDQEMSLRAQVSKAISHKFADDSQANHVLLTSLLISLGSWKTLSPASVANLT